MIRSVGYVDTKWKGDRHILNRFGGNAEEEEIGAKCEKGDLGISHAKSMPETFLKTWLNKYLVESKIKMYLCIH